MFRWIYPDDDRRWAALPPGFELFGAAIGRHGVRLVVGGFGALPRPDGLTMWPMWRAPAA